jgi:hypothetical protein
MQPLQGTVSENQQERRGANLMLIHVKIALTRTCERE